MKNFVLACLLLLLIAPACRKAEPGLKLAPPAWLPETLHYRVSLAGQPSGTSVQVVNPTTADATPMLELSQLTVVGDEQGSTRDSSWLLVRQAGLRPVHAFRTVQTGDDVLWSEVTYTDKLAGVQAMTPMGQKAIDLEIGPTDFDNDQLTTLLRALEVGADKDVDLGLVVGLVGSDIPVTVSLMGTETVMVPAGAIEARRLQLGIAGQVVDLWFETAGRKRMVRYEAPGSELVMELTPAPVPGETPDPGSAEKPPRTGR
jgi:hypothetical protein